MGLAVLWDFHGTMISPESIGETLIAERFSQLGSPLTFAEAELFDQAWTMGDTDLSAADVVQMFFNHRSWGNSGAFFAQFLNDYRERLTSVNALPGVDRSIRSFAARRVLQGIVTGSQPDQLHVVLRKHEWDGIFPPDGRFTIDRYVEKKPSPIGYQRAASWARTRCLVAVAVENTEFGVTSACSAGVDFVVGVVGETPGENLSGADLVLPNCRDLTPKVLTATAPMMRELRASGRI